MKANVIAILVILVAVLVGLYFLTMGYTQNDSTITVTSGDTFTISLTTQPSTGYTWLPEFDNTYLSLVTKDFESPESEYVVGQEGNELFTFQTLEPGFTTLSLSYARPWESVLPVDIRTYEIYIK